MAFLLRLINLNWVAIEERLVCDQILKIVRFSKKIILLAVKFSVRKVYIFRMHADHAVYNSEEGLLRCSNSEKQSGQWLAGDLWCCRGGSRWRWRATWATGVVLNVERRSVLGCVSLVDSFTAADTSIRMLSNTFATIPTTPSPWTATHTPFFGPPAPFLPTFRIFFAF